MQNEEIERDLESLWNRVGQEYKKIAFGEEENSTNRLRALYLLEKHLKENSNKTPILIEITK